MALYSYALVPIFDPNLSIQRAVKPIKTGTAAGKALRRYAWRVRRLRDQFADVADGTPNRSKGRSEGVWCLQRAKTETRRLGRRQVSYGEKLSPADIARQHRPRETDHDVLAVLASWRHRGYGCDSMRVEQERMIGATLHATIRTI
jgi:hypothetical protein